MNEERVAVQATIAIAVVAVLGAVSDLGRALMALVALVMFVGGAVLMATALVKAAQRSRESVLTIGEVFFRVPRVFLWCFGVQLVVAFASAGLHPNTGAAFAILAPVFGLGIMGLWGARHGRFPARET